MPAAAAAAYADQVGIVPGPVQDRPVRRRVADWAAPVLVLDPTRGRDKISESSCACSRTPSITTVELVLLPGMLESSQSRRSVPLSQMLRFSL